MHMYNIIMGLPPTHGAGGCSQNLRDSMWMLVVFFLCYEKDVLD